MERIVKRSLVSFLTLQHFAADAQYFILQGSFSTLFSFLQVLNCAKHVDSKSNNNVQADGHTEVVEDDEDETIEIPDNINYEIYGADWYRMKFPGFEEEHYELMAKAANYTETEKTPEPRISSEISTE